RGCANAPPRPAAACRSGTLRERRIRHGRRPSKEQEGTMTTIAELREQVRGPVVEPGEDDYEELRRVHNGVHDRRPALIVRATSTADVVATVNHAREAGLDLAVRGGGQDRMSTRLNSSLLKN